MTDLMKNWVEIPLWSLLIFTCMGYRNHFGCFFPFVCALCGIGVPVAYHYCGKTASDFFLRGYFVKPEEAAFVNKILAEELARRAQNG